MIYTWLLYILLPLPIGATVQPAKTTVTTTVSPGDLRQMEAEVLDCVNEYRLKKHLPALSINKKAAALAQEHSEKMARRNTVSHQGFSQRSKTLSGAGNVTAVAENVAGGYTSAREVVDGWLHSPGHKQNIEGDFSATGIGIARNDKGVLFFTQLFLKAER